MNHSTITIVSAFLSKAYRLKLHFWMFAAFSSGMSYAADDLAVHGFVSQGFIYTTDNQFYGDSESGSFKLTEAGINFSKRFTPRLKLSSQLFSRISDRETDGDIGIDYLFLEYKAPFSNNNTFGARLGRVKNVIGFYNETRDVAFTRPSIFAPESIYFDFVRELQLSSDGMIGFAQLRPQLGTFKLEIGSGETVTNKESEISLFGGDFDGKFDKKDIVQGRLVYDSPDQNWRFAVSKVEAEISYLGGQNTPFQFAATEIDLFVVSAEYLTESYIFTAETMALNVDTSVQLINLSRQPMRSWYIQAQRKINESWSIYSRYEDFTPNKNDPKGLILNSLTGLPGHQAYLESLIFGAKWKPTHEWMLMLEIQDLAGTAGLNRLANPDPFATVKDWQKISAMLSYRF